jgi:hypothetical protein
MELLSDQRFVITSAIAIINIPDCPSVNSGL